MKTGPAAPDPGELDPDSYRLALALHEQFELVEEDGVRAYARRVHLDPSVVSKSLSCKEVPRWDFISQLAEHAAQDQGLAGPALETIDRLAELYENMIAASGKKGHVLAALRSQLTQARLEARKHLRREEALIAELEAARYQVLELSSRVRELESGKMLPLNIGAAQLVLRDGQQLRSERDSAEDTVTELRGQLAKERQARLDAEQKCKDVEMLFWQFSQTVEEPEEEESVEWYKNELAMIDGVLTQERKRREEAERRAADLQDELSRANTVIGHLRGRHYPPRSGLPAQTKPPSVESVNRATDDTAVIDLRFGNGGQTIS